MLIPKAQNGKRLFPKYQQNGNLDEIFYKGKYGNTEPNTNEGDIILSSLYYKFPKLKSFGKTVVKKDTTFRPDLEGYGNIEYFDPEQDSVWYSETKSYAHPKKGFSGIIYNQNVKDPYAAVFLDLVSHGKSSDSEFMRLKKEFRKATEKTRQDDAEYFYKKDLKEGFAIDGKERWLNNYYDGLLRASIYPNLPAEYINKNSEYYIEYDGLSDESKQLGVQIMNYLKNSDESELDKSYKQKMLKTTNKHKNGGSLIPKFQNSGKIPSFVTKPKNHIEEQMKKDWLKRNPEQAVKLGEYMKTLPEIIIYDSKDDYTSQQLSTMSPKHRELWYKYGKPTIVPFQINTSNPYEYIAAQYSPEDNTLKLPLYNLPIREVQDKLDVAEKRYKELGDYIYKSYDNSHTIPDIVWNEREKLSELIHSLLQLKRIQRPKDADFLAELSHAYQYNAPGIKGKRFIDLLNLEGKKRLVQYKNQKEFQDYEYDTPGTREYEAHKIIQPWLLKESFKPIQLGPSYYIPIQKFGGILTPKHK